MQDIRVGPDQCSGPLRLAAGGEGALPHCSGLLRLGSAHAHAVDRTASRRCDIQNSYMTDRVVEFDGVGEHFWEIAARSAGSPANSRGKKSRTGRGGLEKGFGGHNPYSLSPNSGAHRKPADHSGKNRWCLTRMWIVMVILASLGLLTSVTPVGNTIQAKIFYPKKVGLPFSRDYGRSAQLSWERQTEEVSGLSFNVLQESGPGAASKTHPRSLTSRGNGNLTEPCSTPFVEDLVILPEDSDFFVVRHGSTVHSEQIAACRYGTEPELKSAPRMVDLLPDRRLGVSCTRPYSLRKRLSLNAGNMSIELHSGVGETAPLLLHTDPTLKPVRWDEALVYALQVTDVDVVLYVKNLFDSSRRKATEYTQLENFRCRFGEAVETPVTAGALEVFRCEFPSVNHPTAFVNRVKVHLLYKGKTIPSVAYYELPGVDAASTLPLKQVAGRNGNSEATTRRKNHLVCSCTMIWNVAKFLKEWVIFNSDLGVEKFFLYDNNSDDDVKRVVSDLSEYNVTRINWPWVKTQEAGFSNCAIEAQRECTWILFTDVDEYLFPKRWLNLTDDHDIGGTTEAPPQVLASPLASLIKDTVKRVTLPAAVMKVSTRRTAASVKRARSLQVGQISFLCRNFGPSGRTTSPSEGVTQGYTCRDLGEERHKSMVYFPALKSSLQNVIHHFQLKPQYQSVYLDPRRSVVHHYKYQAWSEFEKKFARRASTYVADWKECKNLKSRDRPDGVGPDAIKPPGWETSHCVKNDTSLRDYTRRRYGMRGTGDSVKMAWEL